MTDGLKPPLHNSSSLRDKEPKESEKVFKWQQQRIARKLRGDYESAVFHLSEVVNQNLHTPVGISSVSIEGAKHTRHSFLGSIIYPAISQTSANHPSTLGDVLHATRRLSSALIKTDIFTSVEVEIGTCREPLASSYDVDLRFKTKERGRYQLSSSTELGNNEASASASGRIRNVFGGAETFEANISTGTKTRRSFRGVLTIPLTPTMDTVAELSAYGMERDLTTYASCFEGLRGSRIAIRHGALHAGLHEVAYEGVIRHIACLLPTASISMRGAAGTSVKSSLSHAFTYDTRDDRITATRGVYGKLYHELAGLSLGGDANFYKAEAEGQVSRTLWETGVSISFAARAGLLCGFGEKGRPGTFFSDRFQLGGPTSVRSFRANSLGPRDGDDSLGGQLYYSAGVSAISDLPGKPQWPIKLHTWVNAGRLDGVNQDDPIRATVRSSLSSPSVSVGLGLLYRFDPVRIEMNFGVPLVASRSDGVKRGMQVGIGLEFL